MNDETLEDKGEKVSPSDTEPKEPTGSKQDPLKTELDKVQANTKRTKKEKLLYSKKRIEDQLKEFEPEEEPEDDDAKPLTLGDLKRIQEETVAKTALDLAEDIPNETERDLVKYHLDNTIRSSGNPQRDLELAQGLVNSVKNRQILEESSRKYPAKTHPSGAGAPPLKPKETDDLTAEELAFMKPPFNLSKEQIIKTREQNPKV